MTPEISDFISFSLVKQINILKLQMGFFHRKTNRISSNKTSNNNNKPFIAVLYNVIFAPDLCDWLFSIIMLMNLVHIYLFHKGLCTLFFRDNEQKAVTSLNSAQQKHAFLFKRKEKSKSQKNPPSIVFFGIIASETRTKIHKVTPGLRKWKCLSRHWA